MNRGLKEILFAGCAAGLTALAVSAQTPSLPGGLPLYFEANRGQAASSAQYLARGRDAQFLISPAEAQIGLRRTAGGMATVRMQFVGANSQAAVCGDTELPGKVNYLIGSDRLGGKGNLPECALGIEAGDGPGEEPGNPGFPAAHDPGGD